MDGRFFGACFSILEHKNGAAAPVDSLLLQQPLKQFNYSTYKNAATNK